MGDPVKVEVVLAFPEEQVLLELELPDGATVADAIAASGLAARFPDLPVETMPVGIWGRVCSLDEKLADGQRVEIYRELDLDPREARRQLALAGRTMSDTTNRATAPDPSESR